jgi:hypothetical protein
MNLKYLQYSVIILFACFMFFASYKIYTKNVGLDLNKTSKIVGRVSKSYTAKRYTGGRGEKRVPVFAFNLDNIEQTLGVYRPSRDYSYLLDNIKLGDTITVFYKPLSSNPIDIDVYQIEKNNKVIVDYKTYAHNYSITSIAIGVLGIVSLLLGIYQIRKTQHSSLH